MNKLQELLFARGMVESLLVYGYNKTDEQILNDRYLNKYRETIGVETLNKIIKQTRDNVEEIGRSGTDSEGVEYNYVHWKDESMTEKGLDKQLTELLRKAFGDANE